MKSGTARLAAWKTPHRGSAEWYSLAGRPLPRSMDLQDERKNAATNPRAPGMYMIPVLMPKVIIIGSTCVAFGAPGKNGSWSLLSAELRLLRTSSPSELAICATLQLELLGARQLHIRTGLQA